LDYHGLNGGSTGLTVLSSYLGLLLAAIPFTFSNRDDGLKRYHPLFTVCIISDVLSNVCNQLSIGLCGSMLFMIIYSSIIVFSALLRWKIYNMGITRQQVKALFGITVGLLVTAIDGAETPTTADLAPDSDSVAQFSLGNRTMKDGNLQNNLQVLQNVTSTMTPVHGDEDPGRIVLGMFFALCGAFGYAWVYVLSEQITIAKENPPSPYAFAAYGGFCGSTICSTYIVLFVGPHWTRDIVQPIQESGASYFSVVSLYCLLLFMCGAHNLSFVFLGKNGGGAVVAGVNKAVQTISVFVISALVFGPTHPEQRMTSYKVVALVFVVIGVIMYAMSSTKNEGIHVQGKRRSGSMQKKKDWTPVKMNDDDEDEGSGGGGGGFEGGDNDDDDCDEEFGLKEVELSRMRART
jgi:drug/metabolite transporter (DMT)-like permease